MNNCDKLNVKSWVSNVYKCGDKIILKRKTNISNFEKELIYKINNYNSLYFVNYKIIDNKTLETNYIKNTFSDFMKIKQSDKKYLNLIYQIIYSMYQLNIILNTLHNDLHYENILIKNINTDFLIQIIDFDKSKKFNNKPNDLIRPLNFLINKYKIYNVTQKYTNKQIIELIKKHNNLYYKKHKKDFNFINIFIYYLLENNIIIIENPILKSPSQKIINLIKIIINIVKKKPLTKNIYENILNRLHNCTK